ncbi:MAG: hypothetical protein NVS4B6_23710 [Mycobacterium sp.]
MRIFVLHRRPRWILHAFGRNPLLRWTDRVEASVVLAAIVLALVVCPLCVAESVGVYRSHAQLYAAQARTRHMVTAMVAATGELPRQPHNTSSAVLAVWSVGADGARGGESQADHADWVTTDRTVSDGDQIHLWLDDAGVHVDPPTPLIQAGFDAIGVGVGIWSLTLLALAACVAVVCSPLNRIRQGQLDREIERFASGGTANRSR